MRLWKKMWVDFGGHMSRVVPILSLTRFELYRNRLLLSATQLGTDLKLMVSIISH